MKDKSRKIMYILHAIEIVAIITLITLNIMIISSINMQNEYNAESSARVQGDLQNTMRVLREKGILEDPNK